MKKGTYENHLRFFYGIVGDLDDKKRRQIESFGNKMSMLMISVLVVGVLISFLFNDNYISLAVLLAILIPLSKRNSLIKKLGLDHLLVSSSQIKQARRIMWHRSIRQTITVTILILFVEVSLWVSGIPQQNGTSFDTYWYLSFPIVLLTFTLIAGVTHYVINRHRIIIQVGGEE